jgi:hypothetical protein
LAKHGNRPDRFNGWIAGAHSHRRRRPRCRRTRLCRSLGAGSARVHLIRVRRCAPRADCWATVQSVGLSVAFMVAASR